MALFEEGQTGLRPRGSYNVRVYLNGDWIKFDLLMRNKDKLLAAAAMAAQAKFAETYKDRVKRNIREGGKRFGYASNEGEYLKRKQKYWGASKPLVVSKAMHDSVEAWPNSTETRYMVGIPEGLTRPTYWTSDKNELEVHEYANIVEHGYSNSKAIVEPRPVFSDTFKSPPPAGMGGKSGLAKVVELAVMKKFATIGVRVKKTFK
jgi:hypothetical protein